MTPLPARVLVTGLNGFTGQYLGSALTRAGYAVHGLIRPGEQEGPTRHAVALSDSRRLEDLIDTLIPTYVVHLAAVSFVGHTDVDEIYRTNLIGTRNLLAALADRHRGKAAIESVILASSANIYGNTEVSPINEGEPPRPANDYAVSKSAMEQMAALWSSVLPITIVRPFNYTGVGQSLQFLIPKIVDAHRRRLDVLELGNLDVYRDYTDVRDVADAYVGMLRAAPRTTLNLCSGRAHTLREIVEKVSYISGHRLEIRVNPQLIRTNEVKRLQGGITKLNATLPAWVPRPIEQTLSWMLSA